jgi:hypothetical protein
MDGLPTVHEQIVEGDIPQAPRAFQAREYLLEHLHTQVSAAGTAIVFAVTGAPGVGKTTLAASYAWACQHAGWPLIAWIAAETESQIVAGLDALAYRLGIRSRDDDAGTAARKAKAWLASSRQPGLLVFDNANDVELVRRWSPATGATRLVVTSRNRAFGHHYAPIEVDVFNAREALAFLSDRRAGTPAAGAGSGCLRHRSSAY